MARLVLANVSKRFKGARGEEIHAVRDASLTVEDGEFMVLVGPSGCGKSTTLRMIAGLEEISEGTLSIDEERVNERPPQDRDIAMVFQNYALYPHMTAFENMAFGLKLRKVPKAEIRARVQEVAETLGLSGCLDRRPRMLSGGQQQRVALGRAIVRKPKVFLFDEPLSNLDAQMRVQMRAELARLHHRLGATMVYVTHDQVEAMTMGDRIAVMRDGRILQVDTPLALYKRPANRFVASFIGAPPMNFFEGTIRAREDQLWFTQDAPFQGVGDGALRFVIPPERRESLECYLDRPVVLGLRPEHFVAGGGVPDASTPLSAAVEVVEPMGAETLLYLNNGATAFVVRVGPDFSAAVGERVGFGVQGSRARFFDPETQAAVV